MKAQFEMKQKTLAALSKLSDRDTFQLASDQLQKTAETLTAETLWPFLSCVVDCDSNHKPALRRECLRLMAAVVSAHPSLAGSHLSKLVSALLRRLRDPDACVREACLHAVSVLSSALRNSFVALARPLFEALAEHNKHLQSGAALSLAALIRHTCDTPIPSSVVHRMLSRTTKMLSNPHFLAKPALAELNAVLIQGGGMGGGQKSVSTAMAAIEACLKSSDWPTRKAAAEALGELGASQWLGPFRDGCVRSLECCRFDKVKPVRDSVSNALRCWTALSQTPSESASSHKHRFSGDYSDVTSKAPRESGFKRVTGATTTKSRVPFSLANKPRTSKEDDWLVEIAVPKSRSDQHNNEEEDSECSSSVTKNFERMSDDDDKLERSSVSIVADKFETQPADKVGIPKLFDRFTSEETCSVEQIYSTKTRDRTSLDSTVTGSASTGSPMEDDMAFIRKQLLQIEEKQSSLMDVFQAFSIGIMDNLAVLQSRMARLEDVVARSAVQRDDKRSKQLQTMNTPRPSVDLRARKPSLLSTRESATERRSTSTKRDEDMWADNNARAANHGNVFGSAARKSGVESKHSVWKRVKGFVCEGDVESAYAEALCCGDELILAELMDCTGPVLECLSSRNVNDVLSTLASYLAHHKLTASVFPWLQQIVDLSNIHGPNHIVVTTKARQKLSSALQEALSMDFSNPLEKRCISQIAVKLHHIWGNGL